MKSYKISWSELLPQEADQKNAEKVAKLNKALSAYNKNFEGTGYSSRTDLKQIITACDEYIRAIPIKDRTQEGFDRDEKWNALQKGHPFALKILDIQKNAVRRLFLPEEKNDTKRRIKLIGLFFKNLKKPKSKMMDQQYWAETRFNKPVADWLTLSFQNVRSYQEVLDNKEMKEILYLDSKDLEQARVNFKNGLLFVNNRKLDTSDSDKSLDYLEKYLYVVDPETRSLLVTLPDRADQLVRHSSFLKHRPVTCAGCIQVKNGVLNTIDIDSGHFKPGFKNLLYFLRMLEYHQIDLSKVTIRASRSRSVVSNYEFNAKRCLDFFKLISFDSTARKSLRNEHKEHLNKSANIFLIDSDYRDRIQVAATFDAKDSLKQKKQKASSQIKALIKDATSLDYLMLLLIHLESNARLECLRTKSGIFGNSIGYTSTYYDLIDCIKKKAQELAKEPSCSPDDYNFALYIFDTQRGRIETSETDYSKRFNTFLKERNKAKPK